jgi:hypothetical protein
MDDSVLHWLSTWTNNNAFNDPYNICGQWLWLLRRRNDPQK